MEHGAFTRVVHQDTQVKVNCFSFFANAVEFQLFNPFLFISSFFIPFFIIKLISGIIK